MRSAPTLFQLQQRQSLGWRFQKTRITKEYSGEQFRENLGDGEIVVALRKGNVLICGTDHPITPTEGDVVVYYCPPMEVEGSTEK